MPPAVPYLRPDNWIRYDYESVKDALLNAKAQIIALQAIPYQKRWVKALQDVQLKLEVGGSSRIEGADFAANELEVAIGAESAEQLVTRSQKQALALTKAYRWIAELPDDMPLTTDIVAMIHRIITTECDEDHCDPGRLRVGDDQVSFGIPPHRGALAGAECREALEQLVSEWSTTFRGHDPLVRALALHYHFAAIHPFADGNGRTARALEALVLQRAGLRDSLFIAMSNYYYDEKRRYLQTMADVRQRGFDLTPFLLLGLQGISTQTERLTLLIRRAVSKEIFRNLMRELSVRLESTRKRVLVQRQLILLETLLDADTELEFYGDFVARVTRYYTARVEPLLAIIRDMNKLISIGSVRVAAREVTEGTRQLMVSVNLDWPTQVTETEFFRRLDSLKKAKTTRTLVYDGS
jgi:Fic family protein